jgi:prepilin-type N-terminal cleavage/methylation domain-containing protein
MNVRRNLQVLNRRGFTLIELIVVILIIMVLAALLLPAVMSGFRQAGLVQQVDDMGKLQAGLDAFKAKYGVYPPSRVRLRENTPYNTNEGFDAHSLKVLKQIWPSFNPETVAGPVGDPNTTSPYPLNDPRRHVYLWCCDNPNKAYDPVSNPNPRANWTGTYELEGDECLVFFLGGIAQFDRSDPKPTIILHGFSRRANDPSDIPNAGVPATQTRDAPLVEFNANRLYIRAGADQIEPPPGGQINATTATTPIVGHAFPNATITQYLKLDPTNPFAANGIAKLPSYLSLGPSAQADRRPWAYFSAYDSQGSYGYRPDDVNFPSVDGNEWFESVNPTTAPTTPAYQRFQLKFLPPRASGGMNFVNTDSYFPNPYTESAPYGMPDTGGLATNGASVRWQNPNRYQLISTGTDGKYGPGGQIPRSTVGTDNPPFVSYVDLTNTGASFDNVTTVSGSQRLGDFNQSQQKK